MKYFSLYGMIVCISVSYTVYTFIQVCSLLFYYFFTRATVLHHSDVHGR